MRQAKVFPKQTTVFGAGGLPLASGLCRPHDTLLVGVHAARPWLVNSRSFPAAPHQKTRLPLQRGAASTRSDAGAATLPRYAAAGREALARSQRGSGIPRSWCRPETGRAVPSDNAPRPDDIRSSSCHLRRADSGHDPRRRRPPSPGQPDPMTERPQPNVTTIL